MREVVRDEIVVDRPAWDVWRHFSKLEQWPSWAAHIRRMDPTPPGELTPETRVVLHMRAGPHPTMTVTEFDAPRRWVWEGRSWGVTTRFEHRLDEIGERQTRVWFLAWVSGPMSVPGGWLFGTMMHRYLTRALPKLKDEIEAST